MSRYKHYLDVDVVTAARKRVSHIFDLYDSVVVQFSGGKDSLVCLHLVQQEAERRGLLPVHAIFRDEEVLPDEIVDFVDSYRRQPWLELRWLAGPQLSSKVILGQHRDYVQWDPLRAPDRWVRPKPAWSVTWPKLLEQTHMDDFMAQWHPGKVAFIVGIRASESLVRYRSVVNKLNENYLCASSSKRVTLAKPIYDWEENDVMAWLHRSGIRWCPVYDQQHLVGEPLRVATPLHSEATKTVFGKRTLRRRSPAFYARVRQIWPDVELQERYLADLDVNGQVARLAAGGWEAIHRYILVNFTTPATRAQALDRLREFKAFSRRDPQGYSPAYLARAILSGAIKRTLTPDSNKTRRALAAEQQEHR